MKKSIVVMLALGVGVPFARGAVLFNDSFSYADGSLITNSAFVWNAHSGTTGQTQVASGSVQLSYSQSEDVSALLAGQPYLPGGTTNVFYAGFTVRFTTLPSATGGYFAHFKNATASGDFRARIWALTSGAASGKFRLGISSTSGSVISATNTTDLSTNTDYRIVTRLVNTNSVATLWIEPTAETDPSVSTSETADTATVATYALRQSSGIGVLTIDDLSVGTTFADAVPSTPQAPLITSQPQSLVVTQGDVATFTVGATGSSPLSYQWHFYGTNLPGATDSSLVLGFVTSAQAGTYDVAVTNSAGATNSQPATLTVMPPPTGVFSILTYNVHGNSATNWSTNSLQVQAIARQVQYLSPDIITFQEIPYDLRYEMTNFVAAYLPGYSLAMSNGTDGFIISAILSRFPITRFNKWLDGAQLEPWGYTNSNFTRDLFEAQISVPSLEQPLHVFTTHLKSDAGTSHSDAAAKRAAEAAAITNFFATNLFVLYPTHPYILTGDLNDSDTNALAIQRLISPETDLHLTNPTNPITGSINTYSIQDSLSDRLDYIMPCTMLFSNFVSSQVFRTDKLNPVPLNLNSNDDKVASDHLAVLMAFANPVGTSSNTPFRLTSIGLSNQVVTLTWESEDGRQYRVDASSNLTAWTVLASNLTATGANYTLSTNVSGSRRFFRVYRVP